MSDEKKDTPKVERGDNQSKISKPSKANTPTELKQPIDGGTKKNDDHGKGQNKTKIREKNNDDSGQKAIVDKTKQPESNKNAEAHSGESSASVSAFKEAPTKAPEKPVFDAQPMPKLKRPQKNSAKRGLLWFAILISVSAIVLMGWTAYQQYLMQQGWNEFETKITSANQQQTEQASIAMENSQESMKISASNQNALRDQSTYVAQLREALTATQQRVRELSGRQQNDWLLAEAAYLINLAEYKITLEKDKMTAIGLLKTADQRISQIADNRLLELRQAIAKDIADLQLIIAPDVGGISSMIKAVAVQVEALDLKALSFNEVQPKKEVETKTDNEEVTWRDIYTNFLDDFVTIKDHSEPMKPLMTPEQRGNLNANIQLALQKAEIGLVRGEQSLYQNNIAEASNWIKTFFVENEAFDAVFQNLEQLSQQRVLIDLPNSLSSKSEITQINQQRLYQWLEKDKNAVDAVSTDLESQP